MCPSVGSKQTFNLQYVRTGLNMSVHYYWQQFFFLLQNGSGYNFYDVATKVSSVLET
jgi:hypothetical protein